MQDLYGAGGCQDRSPVLAIWHGGLGNIWLADLHEAEDCLFCHWCLVPLLVGYA